MTDEVPELGEPVAWYHSDFGVIELSRDPRPGWTPLYDPPNHAARPRSVAETGEPLKLRKYVGITEDQIKYMVDRFLRWKLPEHFHPDHGISFDEKCRDAHGPVGTNLFTAVQAEAMVWYMIQGLEVKQAFEASPAAPGPAVGTTGPAVEPRMLQEETYELTPDILGRWADRIERTATLIRVQEATSYQAEMNMAVIKCFYDFEARRLVKFLRKHAEIPGPSPAPSREDLRRLVDAVWQHATESTAVPSTKTADKLIDAALAAQPAPELAKGRA